jgi:hypothetical protein
MRRRPKNLAPQQCPRQLHFQRTRRRGPSRTHGRSLRHRNTDAAFLAHEGARLVAVRHQQTIIQDTYASRAGSPPGVLSFRTRHRHRHRRLRRRCCCCCFWTLLLLLLDTAAAGHCCCCCCCCCCWTLLLLLDTAASGHCCCCFWTLLLLLLLDTAADPAAGHCCCCCCWTLLLLLLLLGTAATTAAAGRVGCVACREPICWQDQQQQQQQQFPAGPVLLASESFHTTSLVPLCVSLVGDVLRAADAFILPPARLALAHDENDDSRRHTVVVVGGGPGPGRFSSVSKRGAHTFPVDPSDFRIRLLSLSPTRTSAPPLSPRSSPASAAAGVSCCCCCCWCQLNGCGCSRCFPVV